MLKLINLFAPEDTGTGGGNKPIDGDMDSANKIFEYLSDDSDEKDTDDELDTDKPPKKDKEGEGKEEEEDDKKTGKDIDDDDEDSDTDEDAEEELKALEEELEKPDDEKLERTTPVRRRDILKKYPNLFKDFPYLEHSYYREQQFTELLPTIQDAKEAVDKAATLDKFETDLSRGDTSKILKTVKELDQEAFHKLVDDYLPTLANVDKDAYHHVLGNVIKDTIVEMVKEARSSKNEALESAALLLNQFVFGTSKFSHAKPLSRPQTQDPAQDNLAKREHQFAVQQFTIARDGLNTKVNNKLMSTIDAHIDPKDSMTEYVKKNASRDAMESLNKLIVKDTRFRVILDKLWESAHRANYSPESLDKIRSAYVSKAKTLLPTVIKKARIDALKGTGIRIPKADREEADTTGIRTERRNSPSNDGKSTSQGRSGRINLRGNPAEEAKKIPKSMSTLDFLMSD